MAASSRHANAFEQEAPPQRGPRGARGEPRGLRGRRLLGDVASRDAREPRRACRDLVARGGGRLARAGDRRDRHRRRLAGVALRAREPRSPGGEEGQAHRLRRADPCRLPRRAPSDPRDVPRRHRRRARAVRAAGRGGGPRVRRERRQHRQDETPGRTRRRGSSSRSSRTSPACSSRICTSITSRACATCPPARPSSSVPGETSSRSFENLFVAPIVNRALEASRRCRSGASARTPTASSTGSSTSSATGPSGRSTCRATPPGALPISRARRKARSSSPVTHATRLGLGSRRRARLVLAATGSGAPASLERLRRFAAKHPTIDVRLGHQAR